MRRRPHDPRLDLLRTIPVFGDCTHDELALIARSTCQVTVAPGTTLCHDGAPAREAFVIVDGEIEITRGGSTVARLGPGEVCGELGLLGDGRRTATATTSTTTTVLTLDRSEFTTVLRGAPTAARGILAEVARRAVPSRTTGR